MEKQKSRSIGPNFNGSQKHKSSSVMPKIREMLFVIPTIQGLAKEPDSYDFY